MLFLIGTSILIILSVYCWAGIKKSYEKGKDLPTNVSLAIWITDTIHFLLIILAFSNSTWQIPIHKTFRSIAGIIFLVFGIIIKFAGMIQFRSFRKISGLDTSKLVTTGIYRWSRNPLYTGWFMWLLGISVLGQSGLALLLTGVFIIGIHLYNILLEEPYLERIFGEEFRLYKSKTPRYLGIPKR
jgi:protein-S-isoprenylcysteine O-methyltransferase Ste14